jgi:hypothetical protein
VRNRLEKRYLWGLRGRGTLNRSLPGAAENTVGQNRTKGLSRPFGVDARVGIGESNGNPSL